MLVQQIESNVTIPIVMSQRARMHPAMIAIGVVVVGQLFGFVGLFVAVPILSLIVICVAGVLGQGDRGDRPPTPPEIERRSSCPAQSSFVIAMTIPISTKITIRTWTTIQKRGSSTGGSYSMIAWRSAIATACTRVSASSFRIARLVSDLTVSVDQPDAARDLLGVEALGQQLEDLPLALGERGVGAHLGHQQRRRERRVHERLARRDRADRAQQVLRRRALHHVAARARRRSRRTAGACPRRPRT